MPSFKYVIELSDQDKATLMEIVKKGNSLARTILRANILLASDKRNDKYMTVSEIAGLYVNSWGRAKEDLINRSELCTAHSCLLGERGAMKNPVSEVIEVSNAK